MARRAAKTAAAHRSAAAPARVRCAIYTRKSTEDGLEQEYNSLEAQRDACAAYVLSQRHEGWTLLAERYDDGGFSGGTMERPGLQRLLAEVASGRVDTIVIYKVDRLTRSLADFAKIVEVLDGAGASFVSVTQAFNTTTSMGRLTLNMLLSFAQFEREVTGERIRDKIAASKRKGLWMGGPVPLGYEVADRKLVVNAAEATRVHHIYQRYLDLSSVNELIAELDRDGHRTKLQHRTSGPHRGGCVFRRGTLYHLLKNRIYLGDIVHKGEAHRGEHPAIVPQMLWDAVQAKLAQRGPGLIRKRGPAHRSWLAGLLYDGLGRPMTPSHATKAVPSRAGDSRKCYRYYVTRAASGTEPAWRVGARDLEQVVARRVAQLLGDRDMVARLVASIDPHLIGRAVAAVATQGSSATLLAGLERIGVERVDLADDRVTVTIAEAALLAACGVEQTTAEQRRIHLDAPAVRIRRGHELRLVLAGPEGEPAPAADPDEKLVALLGEALAARRLVLSSPSQPLALIAADAGRCRKRMARMMRLSWLAPDAVRAITDGATASRITPRQLLDIELPLSWRDQLAAITLA